MWATAEPQLVGFVLTAGDSEAEAVADYTIPAVGARLRLTNTIFADGSVRVSEAMTADPARKDVAELMRFGMAFETPEMFDAVEYYGRGRWKTTPTAPAPPSWGVTRNASPTSSI